MGAPLLLSLLALVAVGVIYWFLQQQIDNQNQKNRRTFEELENKHESRIQEILESVQGNYQTQLKQETEKLERQIEFRIQETIQSLQTTYQTQLAQTIEELKKAHKSQLQETNSSLEDPYQTKIQTFPQISDGNPEATKIEINFPIEQNVSALPLLEIPQAPLEKSFVSIPSTEFTVAASSLSNTVAKKTQDLAKKILALGNSGQVAYIPQIIAYTTYPDSQLRQSVASALGTIAAFQGIKPEIKRVIPLLGKLSRDPDPLVRQSAVEALGKIKSETVIPLIRQALRDANLNVVKAASAALTKFKFYSMSRGKKSVNVFSNSRKR